MKRLLIALTAITIGAAFTLDEAQARRFGGGGSFGVQRSVPAKRDATRQTAPNQNQNTALPGQTAPQAGGSRWLGPIAGIAAGLGLYALFSHLGLSQELADMALLLLIAMIAFIAIRALMRRAQPLSERAQYAGAGARPMPYAPPDIGAAGGSASGSAVHFPPDFDAASFLRHAKLNFVRLQAANDAGDMDDIRKFTTPELYAEIKMQYEERGRAPQATEVVSLDAEILDFATELGEQIASVRFFGTVRETANGAPQPFDEIWHITKAVDGSRGWAIAGIQQNQ